MRISTKVQYGMFQLSSGGVRWCFCFLLGCRAAECLNVFPHSPNNFFLLLINKRFEVTSTNILYFTHIKTNRGQLTLMRFHVGYQILKENEIKQSALIFNPCFKKVETCQVFPASLKIAGHSFSVMDEVSVIFQGSARPVLVTTVFTRKYLWW